jgi:hypothetical protein
MCGGNITPSILNIPGILVNHQLDAQILYFYNIFILQSSTCFEQYYAHPLAINYTGCSN